MPWELFAFGDAGWGDELWRGLQVTVALAVLGYGAGLVLGTLVGIAELRGGRFLAALFGVYGAVMRSLPELLVIFAVYFGLAAVLQAAFASVGLRVRLSLSPFAAGFLAITLITAAYVAEVVKGAIMGLDRGLPEGARALGLSPSQTLRFVVLPVAVRTAFPGLANIWMAVIKKTPLVSAIQLEDFIRAAGTAGQNTRQFFVFYGAVIAMYLVLSALSMAGQARLERRLLRYQAPAR